MMAAAVRRGRNRRLGMALLGIGFMLVVGSVGDFAWLS